MILRNSFLLFKVNEYVLLLEYINFAPVKEEISLAKSCKYILEFVERLNIPFKSLIIDK